ncbi:MAG: hypothetical protein IJG38_03735 [Thermoguttaceae bacterium]|nr:hypothetical protein [Thermoguttaceae bacterium]
MEKSEIFIDISHVTEFLILLWRILSAIQKSFWLRKRGFGGAESGRGLPSAGCSGGLSCANVISCTGKSSPKPGYIQGRFSAGVIWVNTPPKFRFAVGELRNSVRFANSITAFHFFAFFAA